MSIPQYLLASGFNDLPNVVMKIAYSNIFERAFHYCRSFCYVAICANESFGG